MLTPTTPTPLPGLDPAHVTALGFSYLPAVGCHVCPFGDYQLSIKPGVNGLPVAALVLDEDILFVLEVPTDQALNAAHTRAGKTVAARQAKRFMAKPLFDALTSGESLADRATTAALEKMGMGHLFTEYPEGTTPW